MQTMRRADGAGRRRTARVAVLLEQEERQLLVLAASARAVATGRSVSLSAVARELLLRALEMPAAPGDVA